MLALDDVIGRFELVAVLAATAGAVILIASNANAAIIDGFGIRVGPATVGFIEEGTKLLVPLTLLAFGRYRDPRAASRSPWLWTGFAAAVAWRLWHLYGRKGTAGAVGAILLVMVIHSLNDSSAGLGCDNVSVAFLAQVFRWALVIAVYLLFKAAARKSTPPQLVGVASKDWTPHRLRTYTRTRAFASEE